MPYIDRKINEYLSLPMSNAARLTENLSKPTSTLDVSENTILDGRISLLQPKTGYRASIDALFLAASVSINPEDEPKSKAFSSHPHSVLDIGTGAGSALLACASRLPSISGVGLEFQRDMVRLANQNIVKNGFQDRLEVMQGDLLVPPPRLAAGSFSHVMANPPYYESQAAVESPRDTKALSNHDNGITLDKWVDFAFRMLKPKGYASFVFTAARFDDLMACLYGRFGEITFFPLWPKQGREAKRVIIRARKNVKCNARILPGMVVHDEAGEYTSEAKNILLNAGGISWV